MRRAALLLEAGKTAQAATEMRALVAQAPDRPSFRVHLARVLLADGEVAAAEEEANAALELDRAFASAHDVLGCALYARGDRKTACESFKAAEVLEPQQARYQNHLGWTLLELGDREGALEHLTRAVELDPGDAEAAYNLGIAHLRAGQFDEAMAQLDRALEHANGVSESLMERILVSRGETLVHVQRYERAIESLEEALELAPENAQYYSLLAMAAEGAGRISQALDAKERSLVLDPRKSDNHSSLVTALEKRGEWQRALGAAKRWTEAHPSDREAWNERAWIQVNPDVVPSVGDPKDALQSAQRSMELADGERWDALDTLALAQFANGLVEPAIENGSHALELAREHDASRSDLTLLESHLERYEKTLDPGGG
jgi:superkiller protein 3